MAFVYTGGGGGPGSIGGLQNIPEAPKGQASSGQSVGGSNERFAFPTLAETLAGRGAGLQGQAGNELMSFLANPTAHPAYMNSLKGVLAGMRPQVEQGYQDLSDMFRNAGAMQSGAYGTSLAKYAGEVNRAETMAASDVLKNILPSIIQGYQGPAMQSPDLLNAIKQKSSFQQSQESSAPTGGPTGVLQWGTLGGGQPTEAPKFTGGNTLRGILGY